MWHDTSWTSPAAEDARAAATSPDCDPQLFAQIPQAGPRHGRAMSFLDHRQGRQRQHPAPVLATDTIDREGLDTPAVLLTITGALTNRGCKSSRLNGLLTETVRVLFRNRAASESRELIDASTVDEQKPAVYIQHPAGGDVSDLLPLRSSGLTLRRSPLRRATRAFQRRRSSLAFAAVVHLGRVRTR